MELAKRIGVSTHSLFSVTMDEAISQIRNAGFDTFELVPADFQGAGGFPYSDLNPGVWPRECTPDQRAELRGKLGCFSQVTVHAPHLGVLFGSRNPGVHEEAVRQYTEAIEFALDIGAATVSFHHTGIEPSVDFARKVLPLAYEHNLRFAYENGGSMKDLQPIIDEIDDDCFGLLLDVGHAANGRMDAVEIIDRFAGKLFEIHASGVYRWETLFPIDGWGIDHYPFEMNDGVDYPSIMTKLDEVGFEGPIILEICYARHNNEIIEYCKSAKEHILNLDLPGGRA